MPIVPSRAQRTRDLLARLASPAPAERDAAVAGLVLVGPRVVEALAAFLPGAPPAARLAVVEILERLATPAGLPLLVGLARDTDDPVARRALEAVRAGGDRRAVPVLARLLSEAAPRRRVDVALTLVRLQAEGLVEALDPLAERLLDEDEDPSLRAAILEALLALRPPLASSTLRPLLKRLGASSRPELVALAGGATGSARGPAAASSRPIEDRLVDDLVAGDGEAGRIVEALARRGAPAIPALLRALEVLEPPRTGRGAPPARARGALHEALAALDSRAALHDLREGLESRPRDAMPALLRAAARVGDASVVPALARAVAEDEDLLPACAAAFSTIVSREKLRRTSAALRSVRPEHRPALDRLWDRARRSR
jgi:HEAT repeat protein